MRLIQLTDEQAVWLHGVMQNPLSEDPNPANEDPLDAANRRAVYAATAPGAVSVLPVDMRVEVTTNVPLAIRIIKLAQDAVDEAIAQADYRSPQWERLDTANNRMGDALIALGD